MDRRRIFNTMMNTEMSQKMKFLTYQRNTKVLQGILKLPTPTNEWINTNEFMTSADCKLAVWMRSTKSCDNSSTDAYTLNISIRKNKWEPAMASLSISLGSWKETLTIEKWIESFDFSEIKLSLEDISKCHLLTIVINNFEFILEMEKPRRSNLCNHLTKFWLDSILTDVTIVVGDQELKTHKLILASQSTVFLKILEDSAEESEECRIVINDVDPTVMQEVLAFLYSGSDDFRLSVDMILNIMIVADKYEIENLHEACQYRLYKKMTIDNVLRIVDIADDHNAKELRKHCISFMRRYRAKIILMDNFISLGRKKIELFIDFTVDIINNS